MSFLDKLFGDANKKYLDSLKPQIEAINALEKKFESLTDAQIKERSFDLKKQVGEGKNLDEVLVPAFALVREAAKRTLRQRHFDVQLLGGMVLHRGQVAEMKTGEGKTLTSTLPIYLNALESRGVHVVTVNDYLAKRDAVWMGQIYGLLGLTVGTIQHEASFLYDSVKADAEKEKLRDQGVSVVMDYLTPVSRQDAYKADITYGTNNEFGFDYLRDNMAQDVSQQVQRGLHYAIVDEVDSILIDEARTPLIISAPADESTDKYRQFSILVNQLEENADYNIDEKMRAATLTEEGIKKMEKALGVDNIYESQGMDTVHHLEQALRAKTLYQLDRDYVVKDNEVVIIDEFTGRMMQGRRYSEGLHQAIEAKEGVEVQRESQTLATVTFQNYFRMYDKLSGMTGTAATEAEEMAKIYNLDVTVVPTNRPFIRLDLKDRIYRSERGKFKALIREIQACHEKGQPVLVGTISIEKNELLSRMLEKAGIPHSLLNAKQHEKEAQIIAQAGQKGAVTVATNMAGRGVDIILGGSPFEQAKYEEIKALGGLLVMGSERHESRRIDNQLRGRSGRQGDPGASQFYISMEDDLMRIFGSERMKGLMEKLGIAEDTAIENKLISNSIESAQKKVEGHNFDIRKHLVEYDDVINKHRQVIYKTRQRILKFFAGQDTEIGENIKTSADLVLDYVNQEINSVVSFHTLTDKNHGDFNPREILETIKTIFSLSASEEGKLTELIKTNQKQNTHGERTGVIDYLEKIAREKYEQLTKDINASVELTDKTWAPMQLIERGIVLRSMDSLWVEHLTAMDKLRTGIGLQGYGQRDPLVEYKRESFALFNNLLESIRKQIVYSIYKIRLAQKMTAPTAKEPAKKLAEQKAGYNPFKKEVENREGQDQLVSSKPKDEEGHKIGRNDLCYCGSGKKYKKCHGA
ncbi:MAG: preprotein translocase subunit SecA [Parcubacteria group bacterium]|nr:MAG: preprotein translocase subunit SecA [Parcubacteria group bacterium]